MTSPSHGAAVSNGDETITYTPKPNYYGSDVLSYEITDGAGGRASARVAVVINAVQDAPVARDDFAETIWPAPITIDVLVNDEFFDGLASVEIVTQPQFGRAGHQSRFHHYLRAAHLPAIREIRLCDC